MSDEGVALISRVALVALAILVVDVVSTLVDRASGAGSTCRLELSAV
jgi:hypothetical protein